MHVAQPHFLCYVLFVCFPFLKHTYLHSTGLKKSMGWRIRREEEEERKMIDCDK